MFFQNNQNCWFKIIDNNFKVKSSDIIDCNLSTDKCVDCLFSITALSYQQIHCGSRYCKNCYDKLKPKYYCAICKVEDVNNFVHKKENIFADKALKKDLDKISIKCPDCKSDIKLLDLEHHALKECNNRWYMCPKCQVMHKKDLQHICSYPIKTKTYTSKYELCTKCGKECSENEEHNCMISWESSCPYGCETNQINLKNHRSECQLDHLDKVWSILKELKMTECKKNEESSEYTTWMESSVDKLRFALNYDTKDLHTLRNEISSLQTEIDNEKNIYESIKNKLLNQLTDIHNTSFDGTIIWRIDNFSEVRANAREGSQKSIFSSPFYTSNFGYKLCLRLYPNGDSHAKGVSISLFLIIMLGNYDAMLRWPFKEKVTFIIIDPKLKNHCIEEFQASESMTSFMKPKATMNIPAGISNFIRLDKIDPFVRNDSLFIKCIVDCSNLHE